MEWESERERKSLAPTRASFLTFTNLDKYTRQLLDTDKSNNTSSSNNNDVDSNNNEQRWKYMRCEVVNDVFVRRICFKSLRHVYFGFFALFHSLQFSSLLDEKKTEFIQI